MIARINSDRCQLDHLKGKLTMTVTLVRPSENICGERIVWDDTRGRLLYTSYAANWNLVATIIA